MGPGRALAVGFEGTRVPDDLVALAEHAGLGGVVLFARNCPNLETVLALTAAARKLGPDVLVLVDHRSEEHTSELQSPDHLVCRLLLEKKKNATAFQLDIDAPRVSLEAGIPLQQQRT